MMEVAAIIKALREHQVLQGTPYTVLGQPRLLGLSAALSLV